MNNRQDMYDCMFLKPLVGLEHLFQKWDLKHSQMRKYGRRVGRAGGGMGHSFWHHGLNHVRSKSWPKT